MLGWHKPRTRLRQIVALVVLAHQVRRGSVLNRRPVFVVLVPRPTVLLARLVVVTFPVIFLNTRPQGTHLAAWFSLFTVFRPPGNLPWTSHEATNTISLSASWMGPALTVVTAT